MTAARDPAADRSPHIPVLLRPLLAAVAPVRGLWLDGTFGAGGYTRGLLEAGADCVIGVDRDPLALELAAPWAGAYGDRLRLVQGNFSELDMPMSQSGESAADIVNTASEERIADILYHFCEERASRRIAHAIVAARATDPIITTP